MAILHALTTTHKCPCDRMRNHAKLPTMKLRSKFNYPSLSSRSRGKVFLACRLYGGWLSGPSFEYHKWPFLQNRLAKAICGRAAPGSKGRSNLRSGLANDLVVDAAEPAARTRGVSNQVPAGRIGSTRALTPAAWRKATTISTIHARRNVHPSTSA